MKWLIKSEKGSLVTFKGGYIIDKRFSWLWVGLVLAIVFAAFWEGSFDFETKAYVFCDSETPCFNPLYKQCDLPVCELEMLPPHYINGSPPGWWVRNADFLSLLSFFLVFFLNHITHNKNFEFGGKA